MNKKLIKAHVIPKSFFMYLYPEGDDRALIKATMEEDYLKRSRIGIYDSNILCSECDGAFSAYDSYGKEVFLNKEIKQHPQTDVLFQIGDVDYAKMKLFILATVWRASVSELGDFSKVAIGPHEERIKKMLLNNDPGDYEDYGIFLARWGEGPLSFASENQIQSPCKLRLEGVNYLVFYMPRGLMVFVKTDQRSTPRNFKSILFKGGIVDIMNRGDFTESQEMEQLVALMKKFGR